jgi:hypothetical protein
VGCVGCEAEALLGVLGKIEDAAESLRSATLTLSNVPFAVQRLTMKSFPGEDERLSAMGAIAHLLRERDEWGRGAAQMSERAARLLNEAFSELERLRAARLSDTTGQSARAPQSPPTA